MKQDLSDANGDGFFNARDRVALFVAIAVVFVCIGIMAWWVFR